HYGDHVLDAYIGHVAIVHGLGFASGDMHSDALDLIGGKRVPLHQALYRIKRRLDRRTHRPLLDAGAGYFISLSELLNQTGGIRIRTERCEKSIGTGKDIVHAGSAKLNEQRGRNGSARGKRSK